MHWGQIQPPQHRQALLRIGLLPYTLPAVTTLCTPSCDNSLHSQQWHISALPEVTTLCTPSCDNSLNSQQWHISELPAVTTLCTPRSDNSLNSQQWQLSTLPAVTTLCTPSCDSFPKLGMPHASPCHHVTRHRSVFTTLFPAWSPVRVTSNSFSKASQIKFPHNKFSALKICFYVNMRSQPTPNPPSGQTQPSLPSSHPPPLLWPTSALPSHQSSSTPPAGGQIHPSSPCGHPPSLLVVKLSSLLAVTTLYTPSSDNYLHSRQWQLSALPAVTSLCTPWRDNSLHSQQWQLSTFPARITLCTLSSDNSLNSRLWHISALPSVTTLYTPSSDNSLHS